MVNKAILIGNLGQDPELRTTPGGAAVCTVRLATSNNVKDTDGQYKEVTEWHSVVLWAKTAENVAKWCRKGKLLYIEGRIQTRKWKDKENKDRYTTEVIGEIVKFLGGGGQDETHENRRPTNEPEPEPTAEDEVPF